MAATCPNCSRKTPTPIWGRRKERFIQRCRFCGKVTLHEKMPPLEPDDQAVQIPEENHEPIVADQSYSLFKFQVGKTVTSTDYRSRQLGDDE